MAKSFLRPSLLEDEDEGGVSPLHRTGFFAPKSERPEAAPSQSAGVTNDLFNRVILDRMRNQNRVQSQLLLNSEQQIDQFLADVQNNQFQPGSHGEIGEITRAISAIRTGSLGTDPKSRLQANQAVLQRIQMANIGSKKIQQKTPWQKFIETSVPMGVDGKPVQVGQDGMPVGEVAGYLVPSNTGQGFKFEKLDKPEYGLDPTKLPWERKLKEMRSEVSGMLVGQGMELEKARELARKRISPSLAMERAKEQALWEKSGGQGELSEIDYGEVVPEIKNLTSGNERLREIRPLRDRLFSQLQLSLRDQSPQGQQRSLALKQQIMNLDNQVRGLMTGEKDPAQRRLGAPQIQPTQQQARGGSPLSGAPQQPQIPGGMAALQQRRTMQASSSAQPLPQDRSQIQPGQNYVIKDSRGDGRLWVVQYDPAAGKMRKVAPYSAGKSLPEVTMEQFSPVPMNEMQQLGMR